MPISIKNNQTEILARKLAELTGESLTEAIGTQWRRGTTAFAANARTFPCRRA